MWKKDPPALKECCLPVRGSVLAGLGTLSWQAGWPIRRAPKGNGGLKAHSPFQFVPAVIECKLTTRNRTANSEKRQGTDDEGPLLLSIHKSRTGRSASSALRPALQNSMRLKYWFNDRYQYSVCNIPWWAIVTSLSWKIENLFLRR